MGVGVCKFTMQAMLIWYLKVTFKGYELVTLWSSLQEELALLETSYTQEQNTRALSHTCVINKTASSRTKTYTPNNGDIPTSQLHFHPVKCSHNRYSMKISWNKNSNYHVFHNILHLLACCCCFLNKMMKCAKKIFLCLTSSPFSVSINECTGVMEEETSPTCLWIAASLGNQCSALFSFFVYIKTTFLFCAVSVPFIVSFIRSQKAS